LGYETTIATGTITTVSATQLIDVNATFKAIDVQAGDIVFNLLPTAPTHATVTNVVNGTTLDLSTGIFSGVANLGAAYVIFKPKQNELEKVTHSKITMLNNSMLTAPSRMFPAYTQEASLLTAFPSTLTEGILCQYIRYPKDPKWTYVTLTNGEPMFDSTQPDFQDFELSNDDQVELVNKILQYAGMSIREVAAVQFGKAEETMNDQKER